MSDGNKSSSDRIVLKVSEAKAKDVGRGIARIDPEIVEKEGWVPGDIISIIGKKRTAALSWPGYPEDRGKGIIRIDGATRLNADAGIDDKVGIKKVKGSAAEKITFAPTEALKLVGGEEYLARVLEGRVMTKGDAIEINVLGRRLDLIVTKYSPAADAVILTDQTAVAISDKPVDLKHAKLPQVTYEDIGGLKDAVKQVREMIELPLKHPELFEHIGVDAPKGVLLQGPPGTGKTLLAKAVAHETSANFYTLSGPEIMSKYYGQSEENLRGIFKEAEENAPGIIFIDEIDSIAPKRDEVTGEVERRVVAQLLALMDGLKARGKVVVIGATNRVNALDLALRRPGRFDREIEIGIPNRDDRLEILTIHTRGMPLADDVSLAKFAERTHGYSGADLAALSKEAAMRALRDVLPEIDLEMDSIPVEILSKIKVTKANFDDAFRGMSPSMLREVLIETPDVRWSDIGGLENVKQELQESIEWPLRYEALFSYMNATPPKGILLHGPPGSGKTMLAKAIAAESQANFISVKGPEFLSKWVGESEKAVREVFRKARQATPAIVFLDELDAIAPTRGSSCGDSHVTERVISQILTELDGLEELRGVTIIAATNRPDIIDQALLRPGRFDRLLYIPPPELEARTQILQIHARDKPLADDVDLTELAENTENYTGADLAALCNEAVMLAIREHINGNGGINKDTLNDTKITAKHFAEALKRVQPLAATELERYVDLSKRFKANAS